MNSAVKGRSTDPAGCPAYGENDAKSYCENKKRSIHKVGKVYYTLQEIYSYNGMFQAKTTN